MKHLNRLFLFSFLFLFSPLLCFSDESSKNFFIKPWAVGQSIALQTKTYSNGDLISTETTTYSIVGLEVVDTKNYFWVEIEQDKNNGVTIVQKLQIRQPDRIKFTDNLVTDFHFWTPRRRIQKISLPGPFERSTINEYELPPEIVKQAAEDPFKWKMKIITSQFDATSNQTVQVAAGTFLTKKIQMNFSKAGLASSQAKPGKDETSTLSAWGAEGIPILGLVKKSFQSMGMDKTATEQETELISYRDSGAYSRIKTNAPIISLAQQKKMKEINSDRRP